MVRKYSVIFTFFLIITMLLSSSYASVFAQSFSTIPNPLFSPDEMKTPVLNIPPQGQYPSIIEPNQTSLPQETKTPEPIIPPHEPYPIIIDPSQPQEKPSDNFFQPTPYLESPTQTNSDILDVNPFPPIDLQYHPIKKNSQTIQPQDDTFIADDSKVTPEHIVLTLNPTESSNQQIQVLTGDLPIEKGDVLFVFDRTGSMGGTINQAKASAIQIMNDIQNQLPNTWFGVASFMDYPGSFSFPGYSGQYGDSGYGDIPWELNIKPTDNVTEVSNSINGLWLGYGADTPEDYTRALYETGQLESIGWRAHSKKIVVLFGDAPTHDLDFAGYNYGGDPGIDGIAQTSDDLDFETVVQQIAEKDISVIAVDGGGYSASSATFKGMSIGYSSAVGTGGRYFLLTDYSQIPSATVGLITSETQQINQLSLEVTNGYEGWIDFEPAAHYDVGPNATKIFDVTISVPPDQASGFYPFVIQAIGDGTILGVTYVEVTVPSSSPIDDLGFRPDKDGFVFENESSTQNWEMFKQFFGTDQVEYSNGNHIYAADVFYRDYYQNVGNGGSCDGLSALSMLNYKNLSQPYAGPYSMSHYSPLFSTIKNPDIVDAFTYSQGIQQGLEVNYHSVLLCDVLDNSPKAFYRYVKSQIQNNSPSIVWIRWEDKGHALAPYRFEEPTTDKAYLYVYDSNHPGDNDQRIEFNLKDDTWKYVAANLWFIPIVTIRGDNNSCNLSANPVEMYRHQGIAWWFQSGYSSINDNIFTTSGPVSLLFTDDEGRRLGWQEDIFYDEIPGTGYFTTYKGGDIVKVGSYYIPNNLRYNLDVIGDDDGQADITVISSGYAYQLKDLIVHDNSIIEMDVAPDGQEIGIFNSNYDTQGSLSISRLLAGEDRTVVIENFPINPTDEIDLVYSPSDTPDSPDFIQITTNTASTKAYDLSMFSGSEVGYSVFGHSNIQNDPSSKTYITLNSWSDFSNVESQVDLDNDGFIDITTSLDNQSSVGTIMIETNRTNVRTNDDPILVDISVFDHFGAYVSDGTPIDIASTLGALSLSHAVTSGGHVTLNFSPGEIGGEAIITASSDGIQGATVIKIGYITMSGNVGVADATIIYTDDLPSSVTSDSNGDYFITVPYDWSGTVIPSKEGLVFIPASRAYTNIQIDRVHQDYLAGSAFYTISGNTGEGRVKLSYTIDSTPMTTFSDSNGNYILTVPYGWSGLITPSKQCGLRFSLRTCYFIPSSRNYTDVTNDQYDQNYTVKVVY